MSQVVLLDAGPLGLVTNPRRSQQSIACAQWLQALVAHGSRVIVPEIADYEVRRELLRANKIEGLRAWTRLSACWSSCPSPRWQCGKPPCFGAQARQQGQPTADDKALDGDVILAAQAINLGSRTSDCHDERWPSVALCTGGLVAGHYRCVDRD